MKKITLGGKILSGLIACTIIFIGLAIFILKNNEKFVASNDLVDQSNKILNEFQQILVFSVDIETGYRGFIITGEDEYLEPFSKAVNNISEHLGKVRELTKDNPVQQTNVVQLEKALKIRFKENKLWYRCQKKGF